MASADSQCKNEELFDACNEGRVDDVKRLIGDGADINWRNVFYLGITCLCTAIYNKRTDVVRLLVEEKVDVNKDNGHYKMMPLYIAISERLLDIVDILLNAGADIDAVYFFGGSKAIHEATESLPMMISLIRAGADVEAKDRNGMQPIHYACRYGHVETVQYLIDAGVDVDAVDNDGRSAHWYAGLNYDDATRTQIIAVLDGMCSR